MWKWPFVWRTRWRSLYEKPKDFVMKEQKNKVCKHVNSFYRLKQAPKQYQTLDEIILSFRFILNQVDKYEYRKIDVFGNWVIIYLCIDDMLISATNLYKFMTQKNLFQVSFKCKDYRGCWCDLRN